MKQNTTEKDLSHIIKRRITSQGKISFRDFMEMALYHPTSGYYSSKQNIIGWEGDFFTSPDVHYVFALSIMKQLSQMHTILGSPEKLTIVEIGAGKGLLAEQILNAAKRSDKKLFKAIDYNIIEISEGLREVQKYTLCKEGLEEKIVWCDNLESALKNTESAIILSNEFFDALPVHKVQFEQEQWKEVFVTTSEDKFVEERENISSKDLQKYLSKLEGPFQEGYTTDINLEAKSWIKEIGKNLKKGFVITIDYGYPREDYYSPLRIEGTLLCYHKHSTNNDPYSRIGEQDITAHVDFTSLAETGREKDLELSGYCEQFHFLMGLGIFEELEKIENSEGDELDRFQQKQAIKNLLMPDNMGSTFKVLIQHKKLNNPELKAFSFKNLFHRL